MKPFSLPELPPVLADLQRRVTELAGASAGADFQGHVRQALESAAQRLDLVTREEFVQQQRLLAQAQERISALESLLADQTGRGPAAPSVPTNTE